MPRQPQVHFRLKPLGTKNSNQIGRGKTKELSKTQKEKEEFLIYLQFIYNGRRLYYSFGQTVELGNWNKGMERVKNKQATKLEEGNGKFELNQLLDNLKKVCEKTYTESLKDGIPSEDVLRNALDQFRNQNHHTKSAIAEKPNLFKLIDQFIKGEIKISVGKRRGRDKGESCLKNYNTTKTRLLDFEKAKKYKIDFDTITTDFFNQYVTYLTKTKELKPNTIAKDIATLKVFMNEAVEQELTDNLHFKKKSFSYSEEETDHAYLNEVELNQLYKFDFSHSKKLEQVRDLFIFGCWVGLRFSDYSTIKPEHLKQIDGDYYIDMITQKTGERVIIPCNPVVLEIFEKYSYNQNRLPKSISNQKFNSYIKEVCKLAGEDKDNPIKSMIEKGRLNSKPDVRLWEAISSHTCRRSMITNYYLQGFPTIDLMKISGHRTESNFMKYLRVSQLDTAKRMAAHNKKNWSAMMLRVA